MSMAVPGTSNSQTAGTVKEATMAGEMEGCVMLALSTFRKSEEAVHTAIQKAKVVKKLLLVFVADVNLARYFVGAEHAHWDQLQEMCEADLLKLHEGEGRGYLKEIADKARLEGIEVKCLTQIGRFAVVCLDLVNREKPSSIVTTRSRRPEWVKKFFGAPVDELIEKAGCPVLVV